MRVDYGHQVSLSLCLRDDLDKVHCWRFVARGTIEASWRQRCDLSGENGIMERTSGSLIEGSSGLISV